MRASLFLCLALSYLAACHDAAPAAPAAPPPGESWLTEAQVKEAHMTVAPVGESEIGATVVTSGRITFDDVRVAHIFSPVTGRVVNLAAQLGARVKKGDPLASIESPDLGVASSDLDKARADLTAAKHDLDRQKALYEAHAGAQRDFETAEDNFAKAKAEFERAQQKTKLLLRRDGASAVSQEYMLRSPIDGEVIARTVNPGMEVQGQYSGGNPAAELFTVGELDTVWVLGDIFEMDLGRVKTGQQVEVTLVAYPGQTFTGTVDWVSQALDPTTRTAKIRCTIKNLENKLKPEMFATMAIHAAGVKALAVPRPSVFKLGGKTVVFVEIGKTQLGQLRFERRPVVVDEDESGDLIPVLHGLQAGEHIVVSGGILLSSQT